MPEWQISVDAQTEARIVAAADHQEGDRVPIWDHIDNPAVFNHFRRPDEDPHRTMARVYHELGIDLCWAYSLPQGDSERNQARTRWHAPPVTRPEQLAEDLEEPQSSWDEVRGQLIELYYQSRDALAPRTMFVPSGGTGLTALYLRVGLERFCEWMHDHEELLAAVLERYCADNALWTTAAAEERLCPLFVIADDIGCKGRLIFSPDYLRRGFLPALRRVCEPLVGAGVKVIFHSDGNVAELLDEMIEAGIAGLHPIEPLSGMDIGRLKKRYGRRLILVGNVDASRTLPAGTVEDVRKAVRRCVRAASGGGGHFIGSSGEIAPSVPLRNVLAFYEACREFGRYPIGA